MDPKLKAFLDLIGWSEGADYNTIVTGINGPSTFTDFSDHPFANGGHVQWRLDPPAFSTAAGKYQILARLWNVYKGQLNLRDFSPASQDAIALQLMKERGAIGMVTAGHIEAAILACSSAWASFPGNNYGQGGKSMEGLLNQYQTLLAKG